MNQTKTTKGRSTLETNYTKDKCIIGGETSTKDKRIKGKYTYLYMIIGDVFLFT